MSKLDDDIIQAKKDFDYYLRKRQKNIDNRSKCSYYHERLIIKEERLYRLLWKKKQKTDNKDSK